jgi:hypothetical protein
MMFGNDRTQLRQVFLNAWQKYQNQQPLEPLEEQLAALVVEHPEYHALLDQSDAILAQDFHIDPGNENPFLHLAMHLSVREQVALDRPAGIRQCYVTLCNSSETHGAEHQMMEILGQALWQAQRNGEAPDEVEYLRQLQLALQSTHVR